MRKIVISLLLLALSIGTFSCGGGAGSPNSPSGENHGTPSVVQLLPSNSVAQTNSAITLHAKVLDGNGAPVANVAVRFINISPIGVLMNEKSVPLTNPVVKTNGKGIATVRLLSTVEGFATVQAEVNKGVGIVRDKKTVFFAVNINLQPFIVLDVDSNGNGIFNEPDDFKLFNPANNQATIRATVFNRFGQRASGATVTFGSDSAEVSFPTGNTAITNQSGEAFTLIQVDPAAIRNFVTVVNITATADNGGAGMVSLFIQPVVVNRVTVTANPSVVAPNGTSSILATVFLNTGTSAPDGSTVSFVASCGTVTPFAQTVSSVATATFTAPSVPPPSGSCEVTASIGGVSSTPAVIFVTTTLTVQPANLTINGAAGGTGTYTIFGGVAPYAVISDTPAFAPNPATVTTNGGTFSVIVPPSTPAGTVNLMVRDAIGTVVTVKLTIAAGPSLSVQPGTQTIDGSVGGDATFTIFGGSPPYNVFSNTVSFQPDPPTVGASGGTFAAHVAAGTSAATVTYTVRDSLGAVSTATLNITAGGGGGAALLSIVPGSVTAVGATGGTFTFTVSGGTPAYVITSADPVNAYNTTVGNGIWNVPASGGTFTVTVPAGAPDETVRLDVFDSVGGYKFAPITIMGGGGPKTMTISPTAVSVAGIKNTSPGFDGNPTDDLTFTLTNVAIQANCVSNNPAIIASPGIHSSSFTVDPDEVLVATPVTITCTDSDGIVASALVTVLPPGLTIRLNPTQVIGRANPAGGDGDITDDVLVTVVGGTGPYIVNIEPFSLTTIVPGGPWANSVVPWTFLVDPTNVLTNTVVTFKVTDNLGTTATATLTVYTENTGLVASTNKENVIGLANPDLNTADDVTISIAGANNPFIVSWVCGCGSGGICATPAGPQVVAGTSGSVTFDPDANGGSSPKACTVNVTDNLGSAATLNVTIWP